MLLCRKILFWMWHVNKCLIRAMHNLSLLKFTFTESNSEGKKHWYQSEQRNVSQQIHVQPSWPTVLCCSGTPVWTPLLHYIIKRLKSEARWFVTSWCGPQCWQEALIVSPISKNRYNRFLSLAKNCFLFTSVACCAFSPPGFIQSMQSFVTLQSFTSCFCTTHSMWQLLPCPTLLGSNFAWHFPSSFSTVGSSSHHLHLPRPSDCLFLICLGPELLAPNQGTHFLALNGVAPTDFPMTTKDCGSHISSWWWRITDHMICLTDLSQLNAPNSCDSSDSKQTD